MNKNAFLVLLFLSSVGFAQNYIEGFVYDIESKQSLPYATVKLIGSKTNYRITNADGKFGIRYQKDSDSLEFRFLGFKTKRVSAAYFNDNPTFYLSPYTYNLNTVLVVSKKDKNYAFNLLNELIKKYRQKELITKSKSFLTLTSSAQGIPVEIIEGFYNSEQSLAKGIVDLRIKAGRFGQNSSFPFYSLNNTDILKDFKLFEKGGNILPKYPGNMTFGAIKGRYIVKIDECSTCGMEDVLISFRPKKSADRFFNGTIVFDKESLIIKKIALDIYRPSTDRLSSINEKDEITPLKIVLVINFNPIDYEIIQSINFEFSIDYKTEGKHEIISSNSFLYFYDYNKHFEAPYFSENIEFSNDYDKIIALSTTDDFWQLNYQFPKSFKAERSISHMEKYGYLINYKNTIATNDIKYTKPAVISWNKDKPLEWEVIKQGLSGTANNLQHVFNAVAGNKLEVEKSYNFDIDKFGAKKYTKASEVFNFGYIVDSYKNKEGEAQFVTKTLFDRRSSYYQYSRTSNKLDYINLIFDIYEYYRLNLQAQITATTTFTQLQKLSKEKFNEATLQVKRMKNETNSGLNHENLKRWTNSIKLQLH